MRELNATACAALYERVEWSGPWILVTLIVLAIVNVMVVLGNVLVILAVYHSSKLRNVTNMFIVSLAVADLMVGLAVLPFSATWEVFKVRSSSSNVYVSFATVSFTFIVLYIVFFIYQLVYLFTLRLSRLFLYLFIVGSTFISSFIFLCFMSVSLTFYSTCLRLYI